MKKQILINDELEDEEIQDEESIEKMIQLDYVIENGQEPLRIDKYLMARIAHTTRNKIQQAIEEENVLINGNRIKANYKIKPGDHLLVYGFKENESTEVLPENIPLNIIYEDNDVIVLNKPYGMVVHPGHGNYSGTLVNALSYYLLQQSPNQELLPRIGLVHRIDKDTSGLLVVGKTETAVESLSKQFMNHSAQRHYQALVWGDVQEDEGTINTYIGRHERFRKIFTVYDEDDEKGKHAITHYKVLKRFNYVTLVECQLETGRTHQIRVHMKFIGHTLFNDSMYGGDKILKGTIFSKYKSFVENCFTLCPRQALHAKTLGFEHPTSGEQLFFESPLPTDIQQLLDKWNVYVKAKGIV